MYFRGFPKYPIMKPVTNLFLFLTVARFISTDALTNSQCQSQSCPPVDLVCPCTCYEAGILANLLCTNIHNQGILMHVLQESDKYQCKGFDLVDSNIEFIPAWIFSARKPTKINVIHSSLASLFDQPPSDENNLKILVLNDVTLTNGIQWEMFSGFKDLFFLTIMNMFVDKIDKSFATHAPSGIGLLALSNCSVSELDDFAFASIVNLTELYVQHGSIKVLKRSMFPNPSRLEMMNFKGHQIGQLPEDIFSNMPNLKGIDLSENVLATFPETTFGSVYPNLQLLEVDENPIICGCNIRWITTVMTKYERFRIEGMCSDPKELKGRFLSDLKYEDFINCVNDLHR